MQYRSTNIIQGFGHHGGAVVVGVEAGSGIEFNPASSGTAPNIMPAGDEANKGLTIQTKGTGALTLGSSANQPLVLVSTGITIGNSTTAVAGIQQYRIDWTPAQLSSLAATQSTITVTGLATNSALFFTCQSPGLSNRYQYRVQCSTANELRFTEQNVTNSSIGTGESTAHGLLVEIKF